MILWKPIFQLAESILKRIGPHKNRARDSLKKWDNVMRRQLVIVWRIFYLHYCTSTFCSSRFFSSEVQLHLLVHQLFLQRWPCRLPRQRQTPFARRRMDEFENWRRIYLVERRRWLAECCEIPTLEQTKWQLGVQLHVCNSHMRKYHVCLDSLMLLFLIISFLCLFVCLFGFWLHLSIWLKCNFHGALPWRYLIRFTF